MEYTLEALLPGVEQRVSMLERALDFCLPKQIYYINTEAARYNILASYKALDRDSFGLDFKVSFSRALTDLVHVYTAFIIDVESLTVHRYRPTLRRKTYDCGSAVLSSCLDISPLSASSVTSGSTLHNVHTTHTCMHRKH